jgi:hypothetical protein
MADSWHSSTPEQAGLKENDALSGISDWRISCWMNI